MTIQSLVAIGLFSSLALIIGLDPRYFIWPYIHVVWVFQEKFWELKQTIT